MMKTRLLGKLLLACALASITLICTASPVFAHEQRDVGKYHFEVGFLVEPAIEGQMNGIDLRVTDATTNQPVTGLEKTLKVEVIYVQTKAARTFSIQPVDPDSDPGHYDNGFIPTAPGQYSFRVFGTIGGTPVNETFTSGPDTFSDVNSAADLEFPQQVPQAREVAAAVTGAQNSAQQAQSAAGRANSLAIAGVIVGAIGVMIGAGGLVFASRRR